MSDAYVGEIRMFGGNFAPAGWELCNGQLLSIYENEALFLLLGTTYGGDGQSTFGLPNLQGRIPLGVGNPYVLGESGGVENVTLTTSNLPAHSHTPHFYNGDDGKTNVPAGAIWTNSALNAYSEKPATAKTSSNIMTTVGGNQSHSNMMPSVVINFIICTMGYYPSQG